MTQKRNGRRTNRQEQTLLEQSLLWCFERALATDPPSRRPIPRLHTHVAGWDSQSQILVVVQRKVLVASARLYGGLRKSSSPSRLPPNLYQCPVTIDTTADPPSLTSLPPWISPVVGTVHQAQINLIAGCGLGTVVGLPLKAACEKPWRRITLHLLPSGI